MKSAPEAEPLSAPAKYQVRDLCATRGPRVHELMVDGRLRKITFPEGESIELDAMVAAPLIGNEGFEVRTKDGVLIRPLTDRNHGITLRTGQVVADLHELDKPALAARCKGLPGGDKFHPIKSTKNEMVDFLMRKQSDQAQEFGHDPTEPEPDDELEADYDDEDGLE